MFEQPPISDYFQYIASYEHFLAIVLFFAILLILISLKFSKKRNSLQFNMNIWTILVIGLIVRVPLMDQPYWYDEAFTSAMTQVPIADFFTALQGDVHPPLYYLIVRGFTSIFGHNDFTMRLPALLSSLGLIVTMYHIGKSYGGERIGKTAALITALLPAAAYYATEARYPSFLALLLSIAYIGIQRKKLWITAVPLALASLTHINGWIYVVIMLGVWVLSHRKLRVLILPFSAMALWFPSVLVQAKDVSDGFWLVQYSPWRHVIEMTIGARFVSVWTAVLPMIIIVSIIGIALWKWRKEADLLWFSVAILVPLAQWIVGIVWHPIYLPRTLFLSTLLLIIPVAWWLDNHAINLLAIGGMLSLLIGIGSLYLINRPSQADEAIAQCRNYQTIYATNSHTAILAKHYRQDARTILYEGGNSIAQQILPSSQSVLFDDVTNLFRLNNNDVCIVSQISVFNTPREIRHLNSIIETFNPEIQFVRISDTALGYYLILHIKDYQ